MSLRKKIIITVLAVLVASTGLFGQEKGENAGLKRFSDGEKSCSHALMRLNSLSRSSGPEVLHNYDVRKYTLHMQPDLQGRRLRAQAHIDIVRPETEAKDFEFHFSGSWEIERVLVNAREAQHVHDGQILLITAPELPGSPARLRITVEYQGTPESAADHSFTSMTLESNHAWTMSQPFQARYWFPGYDLPSDKAEEGVELFITVPAGITVAANGIQHGVSHEGGNATYHWRHDAPIATYLVAFSAASYEIIEDSWGSVPLRYYVFPRLREAAEYDLARHPQMFDVFTSKFGPYPFNAYGVMTVESQGWAMEHQTMTTSASSLIRGDRGAELVFAHELAHHWWGDSVTLKDYSHIWLNEGFASYSELLWVEETDGEGRLRDYVNYFQQLVRQDAGRRGHHSLYRDSDSVDLMFSTTIYKKGALVLHALRYHLGDEDFFKGLQQYHERYRHSVATTEDFEAVMEAVSGRRLDGFFQGWIYGAGWPELGLSWYNVTRFGKRYRVVTVSQLQDSGTLYATSIPLDPDGDGPLPVRRFVLDQRHSQVQIEADSGMTAPEIVDGGQVMYDSGTARFGRPEIVRQSRDSLKAGPVNTFYLRVNNLTEATRIYFNAADVDVVATRVINRGKTLEVKVRVPEDTPRTTVGYKLINPDGSRVYKPAAFSIST